jgi:hypothetical protein
MAALTAGMGVGGFVGCYHLTTPAPLVIPYRLSHVHCYGLLRDGVGGGYPNILYRYCDFPTMHGVDPGVSMLPFRSLGGVMTVGPLWRMSYLQGMVAVLVARVGQGHRFPVG